MKKYTIFITLMLTGGLLFAQNIPSITLKNLNGKSINVQKLSKSKNVKVLAFWATWCVPCINELDAISEVYEDWQDETNMELIAISIDNARTFTKVKGVVSAKGWDYEVLSDIKRELQQAMNFQDIPYTFVIDKDGKIVYSHSGYNPGDEDELERKIAKLAK